MLPSDEPQHKLQRGLMEYTLKITPYGCGQQKGDVHHHGSRRCTMEANVPVISKIDP